MSSVFKWRDTTIIILAVICNITAQFCIALNTDLAFLYLAYVLWMLWNSITTLTLETIPGAFRIWRGSLYFLVLFLLIYTHLGMKKQENSKKKQEPKELR